VFNNFTKFSTQEGTPMTIEERRDREKQQMKELILQAAAKIIVSEGYDKLSIRKIASQIEYSPAIIYHYFSNKNEILGHIMRNGYGNLLSDLSEGMTASGSPGSGLKTLTRNYIESALRRPGEFLAIQLNDTPEVLEFTSYLFENAAENKAALKMLAAAVRELNSPEVSDHDVEITAQFIAASTLGLVTRLILEKDIPAERKDEIIGHYSEAVVRMAQLSI
jgi:AcrR family transcriptional regulator